MSSAADGDSIRVGELEVRPHERAVLVCGRAVTLTPGEYGIVARLAEHPGWVYSAEQLARGIDAEEHSPESVSVLVSRVRHRLAEEGLAEVIETVRGFGYRLHCGAANAGEADAASAVSDRLRDAVWHLAEAAIDGAHAGTEEQQHAIIEAIERARGEIYESLSRRD